MSNLRRSLGYTALVLGGISTFVFLSPLFPIGIEAFIVGGIFFCAGAVALGGKRICEFFQRLRSARPTQRKSVEPVDPLFPVRILKLAKEHGGVLTITAVAIAFSVPLDRAEAGLDACVRSGNATVNFDIPRGYAVYSFPEFLQAPEQPGALESSNNPGSALGGTEQGRR